MARPFFKTAIDELVPSFWRRKRFGIVPVDAVKSFHKVGPPMLG
jgi:hypothetical protein